jgi:hypothetical protein
LTQLPEQHFVLLMQGEPVLPHACWHDPPTHSSRPQQSVFCAQVVPVTPQPLTPQIPPVQSCVQH